MRSAREWAIRLVGAVALFMALAAPGKSKPGGGGGGGAGAGAAAGGGGGEQIVNNPAQADYTMYIGVFILLIGVAVVAYLVSQRNAKGQVKA